MASQARTRQHVLASFTPKAAETLFYDLWDKSRGTIPEFGTPHPNKLSFPKHVFCHYETVDEQGDQLRMWYIVPREDQDDYNWEFTKADIGGTQFDAVARTYVTLRSAFDPATPDMGAEMPDAPKGKFAAGYVLAERRETRTNDPKIDNLFVIDQQVFVLRTTITESAFDEVCKRNLTTVRTLYYSGEHVLDANGNDQGVTIDDLIADPTNSFWGIQADGVVREGRQLSSSWFAVTERQAVAGTFVDGVVLIDSYTGNRNYSWPPVLETIELMDWVRKDGSTEIYPRVTYNPEGYSGPCRSLTTVTWSKTAFAIPKVDQMLPTGIHYSSPYYNVNTSECLHPALTMQCDILSIYDPVYAQNTGSARVFEETNYSQWPSSLTADDDQSPFRGGYLRATVTVYKPS